MTFHDIFSSKKSPAPIKAQTIIIDIHEKNSLVPAELSNLHIPFQFEHLEIGDYLINSLAIERKTLNDLQSSLISKRLITQLHNLQQHSQRLLIIEGNVESSQHILHENALRGLLLSISLDFQTPCIFTTNEKDTALYLSLLARKKTTQELSLRPSRIPETREEQLQFILEGFPHIGPATAKALLNKFHTLKNIFNARESELQEILGKKTQEFIHLLSS